MIEAQGRLGPVDAAGRVSPAKQTRLASFVILAHQTSARLLQAVELMPFAKGWRETLTSQYWQEIELIRLLLQATAWTPEITSATGAVRWQTFWSGQAIEVSGKLFTAGPKQSALAAMALCHAVHEVMRLAPLLPPEAAADDPFAAALRQHDQVGEEAMRLQGRLFAPSPFAVGRSEAERALAEKRAAVAALWREFLAGI